MSIISLANICENDLELQFILSMKSYFFCKKYFEGTGEFYKRSKDEATAEHYHSK